MIKFFVMKFSQILFALVLLVCGFILGSSWKQLSGSEKTMQTEEPVVTPEVQIPSNSRPIAPVTIVTAEEDHTINLFQETVPSVVFITTTNLREDHWSMNIMEIPRGTGSGFIWDKDGHIVTNFHVVQGADRFQITLADQSSWPAIIVGAEPNKDLAILKIDVPEDQLIPIAVGSSDNLRVGQSVYAIGNPFGLDHSLTTGIISALGREITSVSGRPIRDVIQTDAAINPGNSGGPLLDSSGRLIAVNTAIYSPSGAYAGIGFSIPVDVVNWVIPDLIEYGEVRRPIIGVELVRAQYVERLNLEGAMIMNVSENGAAEAAGLLPTRRNKKGEIEFGDLIIGVDDLPVRSNVDLILALEKYNPGDQIKVTFLRDDEEQSTLLLLGSSL
jgi:S1-C subfamily serine protease